MSHLSFLDQKRGVKDVLDGRAKVVRVDDEPKVRV